MYSLIIEGDNQCSVRLTECINAGSIPIIIKSNNQNICAFDEIIDNTLFSFIVNIDGIDNLMTNILNNLSQDHIEKMIDNLEILNNRYFINKTQQIKGLNEILFNRIN